MAAQPQTPPDGRKGPVPVETHEESIGVRPPNCKSTALLRSKEMWATLTNVTASS